MSVLSLGLIETRGLVAAIEAADAAVKAANITLLSAELLGGGIVTLRMQGELGAVQAAVEAGAQAAKRIGEVVAVRVIPRPVPELAALAPKTTFAHAPREVGLMRTIPSKGEAPLPAPPSVLSKPAPPKRVAPHASKPTVVERSVQIPKPIVVEKEISEPVLHSDRATPDHSPTPKAEPKAGHDLAELESMSVVRLRQYARSIKDLPIQGRQISMANKTQLLDAIRQAGSNQ